jgi:hypothetical protein
VDPELTETAYLEPMVMALEIKALSLVGQNGWFTIGEQRFLIDGWQTARLKMQ